jgi:hypothetical protein
VDIISQEVLQKSGDTHKYIKNEMGCLFCNKLGICDITNDVACDARYADNAEMALEEATARCHEEYPDAYLKMKHAQYTEFFREIIKLQL